MMAAIQSAWLWLDGLITEHTTDGHHDLQCYEVSTAAWSLPLSVL